MSGSLANRLVEAGKRADGAARHVAMFKPSDSVSIQDDAVRAVIAAVLRELDMAVMERVASGSSDFIDLEALAGVVEGGEQDG